jgi:uncharacterized protein (TIGR02147 family)
MTTAQIYRYKDYQKFLKDLLTSYPKRGWGILKVWSEQTRVSASHLSLVLAKKKDLSIDQAVVLGKAIPMAPSEIDYFLLLVQYARAERVEIREYMKERIELLQKEHLKFTKGNPSDKTLNEEDRTIYYSSWIYSAVRMYSLLGTKLTIHDIIRRFKLPLKKAEEIVNRLVRLGLLELTTQGTLLPTVAILSLDRDSPNLTRHLLNWRIKGLENLERLENEEIAMSFPMAINQKLFSKYSAEFMAQISKLTRDLKEEDADEIACLNIDFFWIK